jgi:hypothetical protein
MLGNQNTLAWLTPHAVVARKGGRAMRYWEQLDESCSFRFNADGKDIIALARSPKHLSEICDIILRSLVVSVVESVRSTDWTLIPYLFINPPTLANLMEQCQSLKLLSLKDLEIDEDLCPVLGAYSRPDLEIVLDDCSISEAGASTLVGVLGRNLNHLGD